MMQIKGGKKRPTNSVGQLDFHQIRLNVKLRVKGGEHDLQRLTEEKGREQKKTYGQDVSVGS